MTISLTYFGFEGSRGLECRLALSLAGVPFEDIRINREQWTALKPTTPFGGLPILQVDGRTLANSNAILAYVGRTHGLLPEDPWAAAEHEAILQSVEDFRNKMPDIRALDAEDAKEAREGFANGWLAQWATTVSNRIVGPFLEGDAISVADLKLYVILRSLGAGTYDHIPASYLDSYPKLRALFTAVDTHTGVRAWLDRK
jgi:glutathione S-transferase